MFERKLAAGKTGEAMSSDIAGVYDHDTGTILSYGPPASHHLRWLASANCLVDIAEEVTEVGAGEQVGLWDLHP